MQVGRIANLPWLAKRALHALILLACVSSLSFLFGRLAPGTFFDDLRLNPQIQPETIVRLEHRYGIGQSFFTTYSAWMISVLRGDFGTSLAYQRPVAEILLPCAETTLQLTAAAFAISWVVALFLGLSSALAPGRLLAWLGFGASAAFSAIPELLFTLLLLYGAVRAGHAGWMQSLWLGVFVLAAGSFPAFYRHCFAAFDGALAATCTRAARAQGIRGVRLWLWFVLPAAANPLISLAGISIGGLVGGSLVVETVLGRPGIGPLFLDAIASRDLDIVTGVMLLSATLLIAGNLAADIVLAVSDPRVRSTVA